MISPSTTHDGLTHEALPGFSGDDEPEVYYPTGVRNYFRSIATEEFHVASAAVLARDLGVRRLYLLKSTEESALDAYPAQIEATARKVGVKVVGSAAWDPAAESFDGPAERVAEARPDGIYFSELYFEHPTAVIRALREKLGRDIVMITNESGGFAAPGMYVTTTGRATESLGPAGRRFAREFAATQPKGEFPNALYIPEAAQAADALLAAIARSDGTRSSVLHELRNLEVDDGILGTFGFDENGDMTPATITVFRVTGEGSKSDAPEFYGGADFDRLVRVPAALVGP
jgi:branched-chain amino acid transport system substrate-binding protein